MVDASELDDLARWFVKLDLPTKARKSIKESTNRVILSAKRSHRYKVRTGRLERATRSMTKKDSIILLVDDSIARTKGRGGYGKFIHQGFRSWVKDPFLFKAYDKFEPFILKRLARAMAIAIRKTK